MLDKKKQAQRMELWESFSVISRGPVFVGLQSSRQQGIRDTWFRQCSENTEQRKKK